MSNQHQDWERAKAASDRYGKQLLDIDAVTGVATGVLRRVGTPTPCVRVYLKCEVARGRIEDGMIPTELDGVPVDVVLSGDMHALGDDQ